MALYHKSVDQMAKVVNRQRGLKNDIAYVSKHCKHLPAGLIRKSTPAVNENATATALRETTVPKRDRRRDVKQSGVRFDLPDKVIPQDDSEPVKDGDVQSSTWHENPAQSSTWHHNDARSDETVVYTGPEQSEITFASAEAHDRPDPSLPQFLPDASVLIAEGSASVMQQGNDELQTGSDSTSDAGPTSLVD